MEGIMSTLALVVLGTQWGDEGKGKVVHYLAKQADYVVRYQGGNNAGHTLIYENKPFVLHLIPSGILFPRKYCLIGNGVVVDPRALKEEVNALSKKKIPVKGRFFISEQAHVILPYHKIIDGILEEGNVKIGTTKRGIGPCYSDKVKRIGIRVVDYLEKDVFTDLLEKNLIEKASILEKSGINIKKLKKEILKDHKEFSKFMKPFVADTSLMVENAIKKKKKILFESAQGTLLDLDFGTYPFVTSSNPIAGGVCSGVGVGPTKINGVLGVVKAYTTRVGEGPFAVELFDEMGDFLREKGGEYGATTGRPRRCGWFDAVVVRHSVRVSGINRLILTKLDCIEDIDTIKICVAYKHKGKIYKEFPASRTVQKYAKPVYEEMPGFKGRVKGVTDFKKLPLNAQKYVKRLEQLVGAPIDLISLGRKREETIEVIKGVKWF
ncbi:MAG: adenylosuccinate synthase [Endomicrobium sp.]|jgi:adenylosuccinate synthase|nr:adenylosuccinate synthase [Endomicrobium sp.]